MWNNYRLDTDFEMIGIWTLSGYNLNSGISGKLTFKNNILLLDLYGDFNDLRADNEIQFFGVKLVIEEYIIGFSQDGYTVILENAIETNHKTRVPGFSSSQFKVSKSIIMKINYSLYQISFEDLCSKFISKGLDAIECTSCLFSLRDMNQWMNSSVIKREEQEKYECIFYDLSVGEAEKFSVQEKNLLYMSDVVCKRSFNTLSEEHFWRLKSDIDDNLTLGELKENMDLFKNLFQLFLDSPTEYTFIYFKVSIEGYIKESIPIHYIYSQYKSDEKTKINLFYTDIKDEFSSILNNWYRKNEQLSLIIDNYLNDINTDYFSESKLLNAIKNLEIYHRNFRDETKSKPIDEELEQSKEMVIKYIEENIEDSKYQKRFIRNIKYNPELTLNNRLTQLFRGLNQRVIDSFLKLPKKSPSSSIGSIVNSLVQTRNYYTHGDDITKYPQSITDTRKQLEVTSMLYQIVKYFIFDELGILNDKVIDNLINGKKEYL